MYVAMYLICKFHKNHALHKLSSITTDKKLSQGVIAYIEIHAKLKSTTNKNDNYLEIIPCNHKTN